jgi:hypothetical protein
MSVLEGLSEILVHFTSERIPGTTVSQELDSITSRSITEP